MRILFCATPGAGHVEPMLPLLRACQGLGHQVAWAGAVQSHARLQALVVQRCFEVGPGSEATHCEYLRRWPQPSNVPAADPLVFARRFGALLAPAMLDPLLLAINAWAPTLVISETGVLAAPLACELTGCPQLTHGFGMPPPAALLQDAADAFAPAWQAKTGRPPPADLGLYKHLYLDIYPRSLQPPDRQRTARCQALRPCMPLRPEDVALPSALSARWAGLEAWPLVYLTLGTVVNHSPALRVAAQALAELQLRLVVTVGSDGDPALLGPLPANVHVARFIAQSALLPHGDLLLSHAGSGTFLAALAHGLPQLALPQGADQFVNACALEASGAGIALRGGDVNADRIRDAVQRLLLATDARREAARLAAEIAQMPSADEVARLLKRF